MAATEISQFTFLALCWSSNTVAQ